MISKWKKAVSVSIRVEPANSEIVVPSVSLIQTIDRFPFHINKRDNNTFARIFTSLLFAVIQTSDSFEYQNKGCARSILKNYKIDRLPRTCLLRRHYSPVPDLAISDKIKSPPPENKSRLTRINNNYSISILISAIARHLLSFA